MFVYVDLIQCSTPVSDSINIIVVWDWSLEPLRQQLRSLQSSHSWRDLKEGSPAWCPAKSSLTSTGWDLLVQVVLSTAYSIEFGLMEKKNKQYLLIRIASLIIWSSQFYASLMWAPTVTRRLVPVNDHLLVDVIQALKQLLEEVL